MTRQIHLTDEQIRRALTPAQDFALEPLAASISAAVAAAPKPVRRWAFLDRVLPGLGSLSAPARLVVLILVLVALFLALYLPGAIRTRHSLDSPMFHGDATRSGVTDQVGPVTGVTLGWDVSLPGPLRNSPPVTSGGMLFCGDGLGNVTAFDASDGALLWKVSVGRSATTPAVADGRVFVGGSDGLIALDANDGHVLWQRPSSAAVSAPVAVVGSVVYASFDATLFALTASDGALQWQDALASEPSRGPAASEGAVYVGLTDGTLVADGTNGSRLWASKLGDGGVSTPAIAGGVIYAASGADRVAAQHVLSARRPSDGSVLWTFTGDTNGELSVGAVDDGIVYVVGLDGRVRAIKAGETLWSTDMGAPIGSVATLSQGTLYVGASDGTIQALAAVNGAARWSTTVTGDPSPPVLGPHELFVGTDLGELAQFVEEAAGSASP